MCLTRQINLVLRYLRKFNGSYSGIERLVENFEGAGTDEAASTIGSILENSRITMFEAAHRTRVRTRSTVLIILSESSVGEPPSGSGKNSATSILRGRP